SSIDYYKFFKIFIIVSMSNPMISAIFHLPRYTEKYYIYIEGSIFMFLRIQKNIGLEITIQTLKLGIKNLIDMYAEFWVVLIIYLYIDYEWNLLYIFLTLDWV
ncbi:hypothetical protein ACJX0J_019127, partial [Zea mays]